MHEHVVESRVRSGDVELAVREVPAVTADALTAVLVHGFPDTQSAWDPLVRVLHDRHGLSVVTYDVRGAGASTAPPDRAGYRTERLVDDLVAVLDAVRPGEPVHLVGHDWGSVQLWDAVIAAESDPRLRGRIASFTSIAGPSLDHTAQFARRGDLRPRLSQALHSSYVAAFHIPALPEFVFRHLAGPLGAQVSQGKGTGDTHPVAPTFAEDAAHGLELYRANVRRRMRSPGPGRTDVPVLTIVPTRDPFLTPALYDEHAEYSPRGRRVDVDAGHWVASQQPELVADLVADWARQHAS